MIKRWIGKIFKEKRKTREPRPYIEKSTECDNCKYLSECIGKRYVIDATISEDNSQHYVKGLGGNCIKTNITTENALGESNRRGGVQA